MKKILPLLLLILIGCSEPEPLNYGLLQERDGVHYRIDTNKIYSGTVFNIDGKSEGTVKKGKFHGPVILYHENGQLRSEVTFKDGILDGPVKNYYENGQLKEEGTFKDGKPDGISKSYRKNGDIEIETTFKDGELKSQSLYKDGKIIFTSDENGQLKLESTFNNGKPDGTYKSYINGKCKEETYKDGELIDSKEC